MAGKRVAVLDPDGNFGTVDESDVEKLPEGARVLTREQLAERAADEEYAKKSTAGKIVDAASFAGPLPFAARAAIGAATGQGTVPELPPAVESYAQGVGETFAGGAPTLAMKKLAEIGGGEAAGKAYVEKVDNAKAGYAGAHGLGAAAGVVGSIAAGGPKGAGGLGKVIPSVGVGAVGNAIEGGVAKALGGLAAKGVLGRAATTGASMAVRGAFEGAALTGANEVTEAAIHGDPIVGEKLYTAVGHGALAGGVLGGILGVGGSLTASGARAVRSAFSRAPAETSTPFALAPGSRPITAFRGLEETGAADAGLRETAPEAERAFTIGPEQREMGLRPNVYNARGAPEVAPRRSFTFRNEMGIDPDAGIYAPEPREATPIFSRFTQGSNKATRRAAVEAGLYEGAEKAHEVQLAGDVFRGLKKGERFAATAKPIQEVTSFRLNPDAGLSPSQMAKGNETADVFRFLKSRPRDVTLGPTGEAVKVGASPIQIGDAANEAAAREAGAVAKPKQLGALDLLSQPTSAARSLANDQAWRAVGGGFGLQSTRYAKEAAKYFPGGTTDLGEIAMRYHLIDTTETATPMQAAWKAAKTGTPTDIAPKAATALDSVGEKIGAITDASGARIDGKQLSRVIDSVAKEYEATAATRAVGRSIRTFGAELLDSLGIQGAKSEARVQDVLRERKAIDRLVFQDAPTLDPKVALEAKRKLSGGLEGVITDALDAASGKVKGDLAKEYKALKRDYHGLRILSEAAEDSAARSSKSSTWGMREWLGFAGELASGSPAGLIKGAGLATGLKITRERGNAAAAAFLSRAADNGSIEAAVSRLNGRVKKAATGVLRESPPVAREVKSSKTEPERGKAEIAETQKKAAEIVKWVGEMRGQPQILERALADEHTVVSRGAGSNAAEEYTAAALRAISFIASKIPVRDRRDPLDPRSVPPMTYDEADRLVRATRYAVKPETIFADFERGKVTPEGMQAAEQFAASALADFRVELQSNVEERMLRGERFSQAQRLRIDRLLGYPAGADLRPAAIARLQANLMKAPDEPPPGPGPTGHKPVDMKVQQTGFDAVEARHATS